MCVCVCVCVCVFVCVCVLMWKHIYACVSCQPFIHKQHMIKCQFLAAYNCFQFRVFILQYLLKNYGLIAQSALQVKYKWKKGNESMLFSRNDIIIICVISHLNSDCRINFLLG